jgi:hypothetical protein
MGVQLAEHGLCEQETAHGGHFDDGNDSWCPGTLDHVSCPNCDDRKCMACVFREVHYECADSCPFCCPPLGGIDDSTASRTADLDRIEDMLSNLTASAVQEALRDFRTTYGI